GGGVACERGAIPQPHPEERSEAQRLEGWRREECPMNREPMSTCCAAPTAATTLARPDEASTNGLASTMPAPTAAIPRLACPSRWSGLNTSSSSRMPLPSSDKSKAGRAPRKRHSSVATTTRSNFCRSVEFELPPHPEDPRRVR